MFEIQRLGKHTLTPQVLVKLFRQGRATAKALFGGHRLSANISDPEAQSGGSRSRYPLDKAGCSSVPFGRFRFMGRHRGRGDGAGAGQGGERNTMNHLQDKMLSIALKISLYPIALVVVNAVLTSKFSFSITR
jgi:hypothetical protein